MKAIPIKAPVMAVGFWDVARILRQVAVAKVVSQSLSYGWRPSDLIASANLRGEVGMWEAQIPNGKKLRGDIQAAWMDRVLQFVRMSGQGPQPLQRWLSDQVGLRDRFLDNYYSQMAAFNELNRNTLSCINTATRLMKTGRFVAEMGLIVGTAGLGWFSYTVANGSRIATAAEALFYGGTGTKVGVFLAGFTKSVSFAMIKTWNECYKAKGLALLFESGKAGSNELMGHRGGENTAKGLALAASIPNSAEEMAIAEAARQEAKRQAQQRVLEAEKRLMTITRQGAKRQSATAKKAFQQKVAQQQVAVQTQKAALEKLEWETLEATEKEAIKRMRAQCLRQAGKVLTVGGIVGFGLWDTYDALGGLAE